MGHHQAKLAVESWRLPLFRYNPDKGKTPAECFDLDGNPAVTRTGPAMPQLPGWQPREDHGPAHDLCRLRHDGGAVSQAFSHGAAGYLAR